MVVTRSKPRNLKMRHARYVRLCAKRTRVVAKRRPRQLVTDVLRPKRRNVPRNGLFYTPGERRRISWYDDGQGGSTTVEHHYSYKTGLSYDRIFEFGKTAVKLIV